jgi:hypothetical protein
VTYSSGVVVLGLITGHVGAEGKELAGLWEMKQGVVVS